MGWAVGIFAEVVGLEGMGVGDVASDCPVQVVRFLVWVVMWLEGGELVGGIGWRTE